MGARGIRAGRIAACNDSADKPHSLRLPDGRWRECECAGRTRGLRTLAALRLEHQPPASAGVSARLRRIADPR